MDIARNSHLILGQAYFDSRQFYKAVEALSEAIQNDPTNKELYFQRSAAYFEIGDFDLAIEDFLTSNKLTVKSLNRNVVSAEFATALFTSLCTESAHELVDFVPSLCHTTYGLGTVLWSTVVQHPLNRVTILHKCVMRWENALLNTSKL